jgi:hypothetical protein
MKKFLNVLFFTFIFHQCVAQSDSLKPERKKSWAIGIALNSVEAQLNQFVIDGWGRFASSNISNYYADRKNKSYSFSISPEFTTSKNRIVRLEIGFTNINLMTYYNGINDSNATGANENLIKRDTLRQKIFRINPGIFWQLNHGRFTVYGGFTANMTMYGRCNWIDHISAIDMPGSSEIWRGTIEGGFAAGAGIAAGFQVAICKSLIIGGEISSATVYYSLGGVHTGTRYTSVPTQAPTSRNWSVMNNKSNGLQFTKIIPSLNVRFKF